MNFVILFCFVFVFVLSAFANQVPVQLYPTYQQSLYNTPTTPVVYQTAPASYNNPCPQYTIAQNTVPNQIINNLVSKVLSNPTIYRILDPNTRFYDKNGVEFQKTTFNREVVPHIINNYFIVPPEFLNLNRSELTTLSAIPNIINDEAVHKVVENVETLPNIPQAYFATKENLVQVSPNTPQTIKTNQQTTHRRKARRKKGKKRGRNKILKPPNMATAIGPYITNSNTQHVQGNQVNANATEDVDNTSRTQNNDYVALDFKEATTETTNQNSSNCNTDGGRKKNSKKRKKSSLNAASVPNTDMISNDDIENDRVIVDNNSQHKFETDKNIAKDSIQDFNINNDQTCPDLSMKELNEECFEDIGSLIACLSNDILDCSLTRNSRDEGIRSDFRENFLNVPENSAQSKDTFAQNRYQYPQNSNFYYPALPFGFDQIYQMPHMYNYGRGFLRENIPKSRSRRRKSKKRKAKNKKQKNTNNKSKPQCSDVEVFNTVAEDFSQSTTTTMEDLVTNVVSSTVNLNLQTEGVPYDIPATNLPIVTEVVLPTTSPTTEEYLSDYDYNKHFEPEETHQRYEELDLGYSETPELGEEDTVPIIYTNGLIDDYYPIFTDNSYYANEHEYTVADLNERYYYTTDRNLEKIGRDRRKLEILKEVVPKILQTSFKDVVPKHTYFDAERESYKNLVKEKFLPKSQFKPIVPPLAPKETFKTPPALENPDFITKRINKEPLQKEDYGIEDSFDDVAEYFDYAEKSSIYSNAKTAFYNSKVKPNSETGFVLERPSKSSEGEVETLFAHSKVAKYGGESDDMSPELPTINDFEDEEVSVVTAQSLIYPEDYW